MIAINMEMPKSCAECPMYQSEDSDYCDITGEWITGQEMVRHKNCPLKEIVTCEDCKYCVMTELGVYCDRHIHRLDTHLDKYCADAERRE